MRRITLRAVALALTLGLLAAACGDDGGGDDGSSGDTSGATGSTTTIDTATPVSGGSITMSMYSETRALDPADSSGSGTAGGTELAALYDTILRWNPGTGKFENRTAESLVSNADFTEWTLKLKSGIKFRDGTAYDAEAVKLSIERHKASTINASRAHLGPVKTITVVDPLTVKFTLSQSWAGFPYVLADEPGMLVSPAALKALGDPSDPAYKDKKAAFNLNPVGAGAGPFEIVSFKPKESIVMKKNPSYWGGTVYLDELRFITGGGTAAVWETVKSGTIDAAFLRFPLPIAAAKEAKYPGYSAIVQTGEMLLTNNGAEITCQGGAPASVCAGQADGAKVAAKTATSNVKVRQAVAAAIDQKALDQRVNQGKGIPGSALVQDSFPFYPGVEATKADPEKAKKLLAEAKAEGYDGKIRVLCTNSPERQATAQTVETMLKAVGFDVTVKSDIDVQTQIAAIGQKDFDLACWGYNLTSDEGGVLALLQNLASTSGSSNRVGYKSAAFDTALTEGLAANTVEQKKAAYKKMSDLWNTDVPSISLAAVEERVVWGPKVHGIQATQATIVLFDKAFKEK
jgi:peptide/nickel transport system substrate-binding protein